MRVIPMSPNRAKPVVYADNAATTRLSEHAYESMLPYMQSEYGNPSQPYSFSRASKRAIRQAREAVAACINANPEEVFFTSGGTEGDNWAIKGFSLRDDVQKLLVTSAIEHHAVLNSCNSMAVIGHRINRLPVDSYGVIDASGIEGVDLGENALVSLMYANNEIGTIQPIQEICDRVHSHGACFHTDAVQAVGHVPIDVQKLGVDMLSASAHKFNGPRGVGFLYIREGTRICSYASGGSQEMGLRAGTENTAAIVGLAAALMESCEHMRATSERLHGLEARLISLLDASGLDYRRNGTNQLPGLMSLSFRNASGEMLFHRLDLMRIYVSTGSACDGSSTQVSHVLRAIDLNDEYAQGTIRVSLGRYSTVDDVDRIASGIVKVLTMHS